MRLFALPPLISGGTPIRGALIISSGTSVSYFFMVFFLEWNCLFCECSYGKDYEPVHDELSQKLRTDACVWLLD